MEEKKTYVITLVSKRTKHFAMYFYVRAFRMVPALLFVEDNICPDIFTIDTCREACPDEDLKDCDIYEVK